MRIAVLCNFPLGLPAIDYILGKDMLVGLGAPAIPSDNFFRMQIIAQQKEIPFGIIVEDELEKSLNEWLNACKPDVVYVFTFPYKIPASILRKPKYGFLNFHTGLLPAYRGADPIFWQIVKGEQYGGITVHRMDENWDTGPIVHIEKQEIMAEDTYGQHIQRLALTNRKACEIVTENINGLKEQPQNPKDGEYYSRPDFSNLLIDWEKMSSTQIRALVRASNPTYGGALTFFRGVPVHIMQVAIGSSQNPPNQPPGTIISAAKDGIIVLTADKKLARLDIVYTEDGFFTSGKLTTTFQVKEGEQFTPPPNMEG